MPPIWSLASLSGDADGSGIAEAGIAIPLARIIHDLEQHTQDEGGGDDLHVTAEEITAAFRQALATDPEK